ncbi:gliding motility-associated ABC transporter substrate-binding protein GldG [Aureivirga sp. CE67]|uniref:gliding motility-associated ABC transporter substrate-binding protein GldG n=1 Tax=Aureivirga sp. CE67 TaxID=1788983 RepID=UPI0018CBD89F|nr:gliding motility-associated ABC transporter substrate-binding protein GldG [Aureivirga sp. CE67]
MNKKQTPIKIVILLVAVILINVVGSKIHERWDLTHDKRYTLSEASENIIAEVKEPIQINVYLQGDFPAEFKRLQIETKQLLEELKSENSNIHFRFVNPTGHEKDLIAKGLEPSNLQVQEDGKMTQAIIFPWAIVKFGNKSENVNLLQTAIINAEEDQIENSIQALEYNFMNAIHRIINTKVKKIAILKGNGELDDVYIADMLRKVKNYYHLGVFTLDSVQANPQKTAKDIQGYDLAIIAKPSEKFTEAEKYTMDQYIMNGGNTLWMVDNAYAELDSLMQTGESMLYPRDLGLTDLFFNYGVRINADVVKDLYGSKILLQTGTKGGQPQFSQFPWKYHPLVLPNGDNPISKNTEPVRLRFPNSMDTLKNGISKRVLLQSSKLSKIVGLPKIISLTELSKKPNPKQFEGEKSKIFGVLLEGEFKSAYADRVKPFSFENAKDKGVNSKMVVISDGDFIRNQVRNNQPTPLEVDKWTKERFGNKEFLMNSINYLLDDSGLINIRSKTIDLKLLDKEKAFKERSKWQIINIVLPLVLLAIFGFLFYFIRKKKYQ